MEYFKILNLIREPFSNSPEPDLFFQSPKHVLCLQKLELAIRLRRGLNIVLGNVGTGKTTLCRHLISTSAVDSDRDGGALETYLLMDPAFTTQLEFLSTVASCFGIMGKRKRRISADSNRTEWQLKESIKEFLFKKGVEERKIVVLIIDEGQKLPDFCLELLREFLNYETNEHKLLQIVIFAQPEFERILKRYENVADRVNLLYVLRPLSFRETCDMIHFRLSHSSETGQPSALFTPLGLLAVYLATAGYPRKIITLCHHILLTMIIQNRSKAGWFLARSCAARLSFRGETWQSRSIRWASLSLVALSAVLIFFLIGPLTDGYDIISSLAGNKSVQQNAAVSTSLSNDESIEAVSYPKPEFLGKLALKGGRTIWWMLTDMYGRFNDDIFRAVAKANPHIKNLHRVQEGEIINLPALSVENSPLASNRYWVQIISSKNLEKTYEFYRAYKLQAPSLRFLPYWNPRQGMIFSIMLKEGFINETDARRAITELPDALASEAGTLKSLAPDTVFYSH